MWHGTVKKIHWFKERERDFDLLLESYYVLGYQSRPFRKNGLPRGLMHLLSFSDGRIYFDRDEVHWFENFLERKGETLARYANALTDSYLGHARAYRQFLANAQKQDFETLTRRKLVQMYQRFVDHVVLLIPYSFVISAAFESVASRSLLPALEHSGSDAAPVYLTLTRSMRPTATSREYHDRLRIAFAYRSSRNTKELHRAAKRHAQQYGWLSCYHPCDRPKAPEEIVKEIIGLARQSNIREQLKALERRPRQIERERVKVLQRFSLSTSQRALLSIVRKNTVVRTARRELLNYGFATMRPLHATIAAAMGLSMDDLRFAAAWELCDFLVQRRTLSHAAVTARKLRYATLLLHDYPRVLVGRDVTFVDRIVRTLRVSDTAKTLTGTVAYPGAVRAVAQKVRYENDVSSFRVGSILVAHTVALWMMPAVERCAGIITDVGGALAHTAIVARELQKPCLVGTKVATETLKDGDVVEINTKEGIAKVVRRS